jgi:MFS transporter, AAHS family, 4-hydroxybenzoate transporter
MSSKACVSFDTVLDSTGLSRYQVGVIIPCALVAMSDGFDTQSIGLVAPDIASAWRVSPATFGLVFGIGMFGALVGALLFGLSSDRFGRRPNLIAAVSLFPVVTLVTPLVTSIDGLLVVRFLTGLGLGGALPGIISFTSEFTPRRMRTTVVSLMFCGFPLGAVIGGVVAAKLIPTFGWQSVFYLGGALPLLLIPLFALRLPESARYLAINGDYARLRPILERMGSRVRAEDIAPEAAATRSPATSLFTEGRACGTLLLWATLFLSLLVSYVLVNWVPIMARHSGVSSVGAILGVAVLNLGGILGCLVLGRLTDRFRRPALVLGFAYTLGGIAVASIGLTGASGTTLLITAFLAGFLALGAQICTVAFSADFYETALRATGVGWAAAVGRIGAIVGPVLGGLLIGTGMTAPGLFLFTGLASVAAAGAAFALGRRSSGTLRQQLRRAPAKAG